MPALCLMVALYSCHYLQVLKVQLRQLVCLYAASRRPGVCVCPVLDGCIAKLTKTAVVWRQVRQLELLHAPGRVRGPHQQMSMVVMTALYSCQHLPMTQVLAMHVHARAWSQARVSAQFMAEFPDE